MKRMRKLEVKALARATSPWMQHHFGKGKTGGFWDASGGDFATAPDSPGQATLF